MITAILLAILPLPDDIVRDSVSVTEINHYYDHNGCHIFDQIIYWDWEQDHYSVRAWELLKHESQIPRYIRRREWVTTHFDGETLRRVRAESFRETWTQWDVELLERDLLPPERRRGLRK